MSTSTVLDRIDTPGRGGRGTPRVELDVPVALSAVRTAGLQVVPDARGGTVVTVGHPALHPLLPYLPAAGSWAWVADGPEAIAARRAERPPGTLVLDGRDRPGRLAGDADLVVLEVDALGPTRATPAGVLLDLARLPGWRLGSALFAAPLGVVGVHVDLAERPLAGARETAGALAPALRAWAEAGRGERPVLLLRGARTVAARHVVAAVLRVCAADRLPVPVVRVDVSATVLDVAVSTVVRVLAVHGVGGGRVVHVDGLPPGTGSPLRVLRADTDGAPAVGALLNHRGRVVSARVRGLLTPGCELAASGWSATGRPVHVRGFRLAAAG